MEMTHTTAQEATRNHVVFGLGSEEYAVPVNAVRGIIETVPSTPMPGAPSHVRGVINLRGRVVPLIDLRSRLAMPPREDEANARILVADINDATVGLLVDGVSEVLEVDDDAIQPAPAELAGGGTEVANLLNVGERLIVVLDLDQLIEDSDHILDTEGDGGTTAAA